MTVSQINSETTIWTGTNNDELLINFGADKQQTYFNGVGDLLTLHGEQGSDEYQIGLAGTDNATINVNDLGGSNDPGVDNLIVYGTNNDDFFLFRAYLNDQGQIDDGMISAYEVDADGMLIEDGYFERINYDLSLIHI